VILSKSLDRYFLTVTRRGPAQTWKWQIHRRVKPLAVKLYEDGFKSEVAARRAGEKALREFLRDLAQEQDD
jgi:hypothetical protein